MGAVHLVFSDAEVVTAALIRAQHALEQYDPLRTAGDRGKIQEIIDLLNDDAPTTFYPSKWWKAEDRETGSLLAETSAPSDFKDLDLLDKPGVKISRLYEYQVTAGEWREEQP